MSAAAATVTIGNNFFFGNAAIKHQYHQLQLFKIKIVWVSVRVTNGNRFNEKKNKQNNFFISKQIDHFYFHTPIYIKYHIKIHHIFYPNFLLSHFFNPLLITNYYRVLLDFFLQKEKQLMMIVMMIFFFVDVRINYIFFLFQLFTYLFCLNK